MAELVAGLVAAHRRHPQRRPLAEAPAIQDSALAVAASDWPAGGQAMAAIRQWVAVNLGLGVAIVVITLLL